MQTSPPSNKIPRPILNPVEVSSSHSPRSLIPSTLTALLSDLRNRGLLADDYEGFDPQTAKPLKFIFVEGGVKNWLKQRDEAKAKTRTEVKAAAKAKAQPEYA
jgi:hypothetical protein